MIPRINCCTHFTLIHSLIRRKIEEQLSEDDLALLDRVAAITQAGNDAFTQLRTIYENEARLRVPPTIKSFTQSGVKMINLSTDNYAKSSSKEGDA